MRHMADAQGVALEVDSAGTGAWHAGDTPDGRMTDTAARRGFDLSTQRARQVKHEDFYAFTHIFAMDRTNLADLKAIQPSDGTADLSLFLDGEDVPDPYYGGQKGFEQVLDLVEQRVAELLVILGD